MRGENATILLPLGLSLDLFVYPDREGFADFKLEKLQITPVWSRLFSTDPAIQIDGKLASGAVDGEGSQKGDVRLNFEDISVLSLQESDLPYRISGLLNGELHGEGMTDPLSGRGEFAFVLKDGAALGLEKIGLPGRLVIGTLRLAGKFNQRRFSLEKVLLSGGGNILIGETPEQTRLNLNIRLLPTGITSEALLDMLKLTGVRPTTDGSYLLRIGGTLAKPVVR
jgi:type II secretion system protein N